MSRYIFGPVPSRRLGISLGVDLGKPKTCNLDCVFCECGPTLEKTLKRGRFVPYEEVIRELDIALKEVKPDYVTFSGSGEPTLSLDLGRVIHYIKKHYHIKVAVITNAVLLSDIDVIEEIKEADLVMPSLHTVKQEVFEKIVRPDSMEKIETILQGLKSFSKQYKGQIDLELFLWEGVNTSWEDLHDYANFVKQLSYHRLQLNYLDRPGSVASLKPMTKDRLEEIQKFLTTEGLKHVEIIGKFSSKRKIERDEERLKVMEEKRKYTKEEIEKLYK